MDPSRESYETGRGLMFICITGGVFLLLAARHWAEIRDPGTNRRSVLSWWLLYGSRVGTLLLGVFGIIIRETTWWMNWIGGGLIGCLVAALVVSLMALRQTAVPGGEPLKGRASARQVAIVSGILLAIGGVKLTSNFRAPPPAAPLTRAGTLRFPELNFSFALPGPPWARVDSTRVLPGAQVLIRKARPEVAFAVVAENGAETGLATADVAALQRANLTSQDPNVTFKEEPGRVAGIDGLWLEADARIRRRRVHYCMWVAAHRGGIYQLHTWSALDDPARVRSEARALVAHFSLIDPNARLESPSVPGIRSHSSVQSGFEVSFGTNHTWMAWPNVTNVWPGAEFGALRDRGEVGLMIANVPLAGRDPHWEALADGFLARLGQRYPSAEIRNETPYATNGLTGRTLSLESRTGTDTVNYRLRLLKGRGRAWMLASFAGENAPTRMQPADLDRILDGVAFPDLPPLAISSTVTSSVDNPQPAAFFYNQVGLHYHRAGQMEPAAAWFRLATSVETTNQVYFKNALTALEAAAQFAEALRWIDDRGSNRPVERWMLASRASLLAETGNTNGALAAFGELFAAGRPVDTEFILYLNLVAEHQSPTSALAHADAWLRTNDSVPVRLFTARVQREAGNFDEAEAILRREVTRQGFNAEAAWSLAETCLAAGRGADAIKVTEELAAHGHETADTLILRGRSQVALKRYREAKATFEAALAKQPQNAGARRYIEAISGILGEGNNSAIKTPIAPVMIPTDVLARAGAAGMPSARTPSDHGAYEAARITAVSFVPGTELRTTEYLRLRILNATGASRFNTLQFSFDPLAEEIFVNELLVRNAAGSLVATGRVADYYVVDENRGESVSQQKELNAPVPGLEPGATVEVTVTRRDLGRVSNFTHRAVLFSRAIPVAYSAVWLTGDVARIRAEASPSVTRRTSGQGVVWETTPPPTYRWEPLQVPVDRFLPLVYLNDARNTWEAEVDGYLDDLRELLVPDPALRALAEGHAGGTRDAGEQLMNLARFVQNDISYKAIEFGRRARIPVPAARTAGNRYGDCKDKSLLLHQILRAAGIESQLALVHGSQSIRTNLPSLDQFNHMIVHVPGVDGGLFVDPTVGSCDPRRSAWGLAGQTALLLERNRPVWRTIPRPSGTATEVTIDRDVAIQNRADLSLQETATFKGHSSDSMRQFFKLIDPSEHVTFLQNQFRARLPGLEIKNLVLENLDDPRKPLVVRCTAVIKGKIHEAAGQRIAQLPQTWEHYEWTTQPVADRQTPFQVRFSARLQTVTRLLLPADWSLAPADARVREMTSPYLSTRSTTRVAGGTVVVEAEADIRAGEFPASAYAPYVAALESAERVAVPTLALFAADAAKPKP